jgi:hypothetical protein
VPVSPCTLIRSLPAPARRLRARSRVPPPGPSPLYPCTPSCTRLPVRLMKRDLLFIVQQMLPLLDDRQLEMVARHRGIRAKEREATAKLLTVFVRKAEESDIGKLIVETVILLAVRTQPDGGKVLRAAAQAYKVDTDAIALKVKQEFRRQGEGEECTPKPHRSASASPRRPHSGSQQGNGRTAYQRPPICVSKNIDSEWLRPL